MGEEEVGGVEGGARRVGVGRARRGVDGLGEGRIAVGEATEADVGELVVEGHLVDDRSAGVEEDELVAVGVQAEAGVEVAISAVEPDEEVARRLEHRADGEGPGALIGVVLQAPTRQVDRFDGAVVELDPVVELVLVVPHDGLVAGHELVEHHGVVGRHRQVGVVRVVRVDARGVGVVVDDGRLVAAFGCRSTGGEHRDE